jgi:hypothetical protein
MMFTTTPHEFYPFASTMPDDCRDCTEKRDHPIHVQACTECKRPFEPHNPGVYQTACDNCDHRDALVQDTVRRVLEGRLGRFDVKFSWFRQQMLDEFPDPINDDEIHALFLEHVSKPTKGDHDAFGVDPPNLDDLMKPIGLPDPAARGTLAEEGPAGDELRRKQVLVNQRLANHRNSEWQGWSAPTTDSEQPERKPLADRTLGEVADAVTKKARAFVRLALGSRRT